MAKTYKVIVNTGKEKADPTIEVVQGAGDRGQPVRIKAQAGAKYQLQELERNKQVAPDGVKVKRVGKDLWLMFEEESQPSLILEDYYEVMPEGHNGVVGQAEDGLFYEYIPEDPKVSGLVSELAEGGQAVNVALGGVEVSGAGVAAGVVAFPWLAALGVAGGIVAAGALAYQTMKKDKSGTHAGDLASASDSGQSNADNLTNNKTNLVVQGQATPGSTVDVLVKNSSGMVVYQGKVTADADGNFNYTVPGPLPDGVYTPYTGETQGKPFTIDTVTRVDITDPGRVGTLSPISGTAEPGGTVVVKDVNGQVLGTVVANAQGVWQITPTTPVPAGAITAEVTDPAGNKANDSDMPVGLGVKTALSLDPISGDNVLLASESGATTLPVTGKVTGTFKEGDVVNLTLNGKNYAASVGADGRFSVPVSMADLKADPDTKIEARITGTDGDNATAAQDYTVEAGNTPAQTALSINPVTADNILSAAENTGSIAMTGTVTGKFAAGDVVTLKVNGKTFTGTAAANGSYSISVPAADLAADPDTQIEGTITGTGGTAATALQDYALESATPMGAKTALSLDPISGDNVLLASESGATTLPVTGKVTGTFKEGDVVNVSLNGKTYAASVAADGSFSVPVSMADLKADPDTKIEARITGTDGDTATAAQDYNVEAGNTPTQTALSVDPVTADNVLSASEKSANVAITGQATGKFATGDTVTLSVNGKTFTGTVAANGKFSINVPGADLAADPDTQLEARITGTGGTAATALQDYALSSSAGGDRNATIPPSGELAPGSDSGVPGDRTTNDTTPTIIGQVPAGATATITLNGKTYPVDVKPDGSYSFTQPDGLPDGTYTPVLNVTKNGETSATPIDPFTIDTVPPSVAISADKIQLLAGQTSTITFTLSEAVTDFSAADITVSGGTLGNLVQSQTDPKVYTAVFTPNTSSTTTSVISVASGRFSDAANNFNTDGAEANNTLNLPTNTQTPGGTIFLAPSSDSGTPGDNRTNDNTPSMTGQVPVGSTAVVSINGKTYPVDVKPDGSYTFTVPTGLPDGTYVPKIIITPAGSSTPNAPQDGTPFTIDTVPPTVLVSSDKATLATGQTATITFTLSEDSTDFTLADVTATGGTLSNLQGSGKSYTATFTPSANSTATSTVKVDSFKFSDAAGNFNTDGADTAAGNTNIVSMPTNTAQADTTAPTIALSADRTSLATGQTTVVTFTLSEASSDFTLADITATGGTFGNLVQSQTDPKIYTAVFTPNASSTTPSVISVASNKFSDAAGNQNADGADANNTLSLPTNTTPAQTSGELQPQSDSGTKGDNKTLDNTPAYGGTAPAGSQVEVVINGKTYTTVADSNGQYSVVVPDALPDGTYVPKIIVTPAGSNTPNAPQDGTPFTIDTTPPTVVVSSDKSTLGVGQTATITFTLNEASSDFTLADVQVSGGTLSNFQGSGTSYTATFTPNAGSIDPSVVHVASNKFADAAGNVNTDGAQSNNTVSMATNTMPADTTAPTIVVARTNAAASLKAGDTETITFTLSEASTNFNEGDVTVTGGTLSNFTAIPSSGTSATGYTQYTATFTPTANVASGSATVGVVAGKFSDNAGNANQDDYNLSGAENANNRVSFSYNTTTPDTTPPTVALSRTGTGNLAAGGTEVINIVLSEASNNFDLSDIVVTGGTLSGFAPLASSGNASTGYTDYVVTFTPNANATGTATIGVASLKFSDAVGNNNLDTFVSGAGYEANNQVSLGYNTTVPDTTPPTVAVSRSGLGTVSSTETIYFTLSEASTDFALDDVTVNGGTLSGFAPVASSGSAANGYTQYQATFTPTANSSGMAAVGVVSGTFRDAAGNANQDTFVSGVTGTVQEANNAVSFNVNTVLPDNTRPTVAVSRSGTDIVTGPETISFTLSEASTTFAAEDISVTGGTLSGFAPVLTSGSAANGYTEYTATFTPASGTSGSATVGVASDKFADAAGNYNKDTFVANVAGTTQEVNNSVNFTYNSVAADTTPPTIAVERLGSGTLSANASETIRFTISEATKDFTLADIAVTGGTLSNLAAVPTSGTVGTGYTVYVATFTPAASASGQASIGVLSSKFSDAAGNLNQDTYTNPATAPAVFELNNKVDISYNTLTPSTDTTSPTVIVARAGSATLQTGGAETITFTLSEPSLSFDLSDITVTGGGTLGALTMVTGSGTPDTGYTVYTATYTPPANANSTTTIGVLSDKFTDAAGNLNKDTYQSGVLGTSVETNNLVSVAYNTTVADTTAPKVEVLRSASGTMTGPETIYFNFSEAINPGSFSLGDIVATGGTMSNLVAVSGSNNTQFIATFTPNATSTGTATIAVGASAVTDVAGNANSDTYLLSGTNYEANNQVSAAFNTNANPTDTTPPTVAISRLGSGAVTSTETLVLVFSEPVNGFDASDIVVTANGSALASNQGVLGTVTEVAGSGGTQYTVSYTAPAGSVGSVTLGIKSATFTDRATAPNANQDTYEANVASTVQEANNQLTLTWDTDTTAPTVAVSRAGSGTLTGNNTDTITFTLSEASADFTQADVTTTGGTLSNWTRISATQYTATFTPTPNISGTAAIGVRAGTFNDLGGNANADDYTLTGAENTNNKVDIAFNTLGTTFTVNNDSASVNEDGAAITGNVKTNDSLVANVTSVSQGGTSGTVGVALPGTYGSLTLNADGSYTYAIDNTKAAVQALRAGQTVTEVFSYTGANTGATQSASANLTITITGTNDAPVAVADTASAVEAGGTANGIAGTNPTGNVLSNDTDVDTGDTKTVSAISGGTVGAAKSGTYGSLTLNADGSYSYALDNSNAAVQALLPSSTALTDTFTYTVRDGSNATSTATVTISITGANDAPQVQVALVDTTAATGSAFSYTFAGNNGNTADTFRDVDTGHQTTLSYTASLADGSSLPSWLSFNATTRTFSGTPPVGTTPGNITVKVTATDSLGLTASDDFVIALAAGADTTPPTIAITSNQASLSAGQSATITFTFSEPVSGFVWDHLNPSASTNDIVVTGGTLGQLTQSGSDPKVYTATFTPTNNSTTAGTIGVRAGKFTDLATTPNANVDDYTLTGGANNNAENTNNLVTISVNTTAASSLTLINDTATAKEAGVQNGGNTAEAGTNPSTTTQAAGVLGNDTAATSVTQIAASGGSNSAVSSGSTGASNGTSVTGQYGTLVMGANGTYTYTLSNTNGTVNALQAGSSLTDVFTYTATDGTTTKTANLTVTINGTNDAPTVALPLEDQVGIVVGNSVNYTFDSGTFADVDTGDTKTYTATMADGTALPNWLTFDAATRNFSGTPPAVGVYAVKVIATDARGATTSDEFNIAVLASRSAVVDDTPPTVAVVRAGSGTLSGTETITFTLSEDSSDFTQADVFVTSGAGTLSNWTAVSGSVYTANFTPTANSAGSVTIGVRADKFSDAAGNPNEDDYTFTGGANSNAENNNNAVTFAYKTDNTAPTIAITGPSGAVSGPSTITFTLSEVSSDFVWDGSAGDIVVTGGGTLSAITPSSTPGVWTATYTPPSGSGTGTATISVASNKFSDAAGNFNADGADSNNSLSVNFDTVAPTVAVSRATNATLGSTGSTAATETITFTLSEASSDFTSADVVVSAGALSNWTAVSSTVYTATYTPPTGANAATGTATIGVRAGKFQDAAGNQNADDFTLTGGANSNAENNNNVVSVAYDTVVPTQTVSFSSMTKDSGLSSGNANWTTADASAGRLLSGFVSAPLGSGETVQVWAKKDSGAAVLLGTATVDAGGTTWEYTDTTNYVGATGAASNAAGWTYSAKVVDAVGNSAPTASREVTLEASASGTSGATSAANQITYAASDTVHALDGNDTITVTASTLQSDLTSAGFINGGAGIDTLKLAAGTTINLQLLTSNQTVQKLQEVEIIQMQGGNSSLTLSANNVLSLGGANASTMTPFTFTSTQQVADGGVTATGSTSSSGKVQMVIQGGATDALKLDALATDGVSSSAGVLGNSGLTGSWAYKGQVQIGTISYKVYDHSTTQAQVLVDVPVVVTTVSPIAITAIDDGNGSSTTANGSKDTGTSASDFITSDTTLVYKGTVPVEYNDANHDVFVEILNSSGTVVQSGTATVSGSNWTLDQTGSPLTAGNYTIRSTIVGQGNTTAVSSFGSQGVDTQPLVIDTTAPTIVVARAGSGTLSVGQTETITFTLSEASTNFTSDDITVTGGTLTNFSGSGTSYSATFTPTGNTSSTGSISVASAKFSDAAGNQNADGAEANNTVSVPYVTSTPTQTVTFSSMTKDSGIAAVTSNNTSSNANWTTADGSAGRLVSGSVSAALNAGEVVEVYVNKMDGAGAVKIGNATVNGTHWAMTDHNSYVSNAAWVYSAKVVDAAGNSGSTRTQNVLSDYVESAPVITSSTNTSNASVPNQGTSNELLKTISGTGNPGDTVYLVENTDTNVVGTATVGVNGQWSVTLTGTRPGGANSYAAYQLDPHGNTSALSNIWQFNQNLPVDDGFDGSFGTTNSWDTVVAGMTKVKGTPDLMTVNGSNIPANTIASANGGAFYSAVGTIFNGDPAAGWVNEQSSFRLNNLVVGGTYSMNFLQSVIGWDSGGLMWNSPGNFEFYSGTTLLGSSDQMVGRTTAANVWTADTVNFTATASTMDIIIVVKSVNGAQGTATRLGMDGFSVQQVAGSSNADNTLVAGRLVGGPTTSGETLAFVDGALTGLAGNDVITVSSNQLQAKLAAGGYIDGDAGADTLRLAAGTVLDLDQLTRNQTVKPIQEVEIFQLQGGSTLTMSANDVLSLGGSNATTMNDFSFSSTTSGSGAGYSSTGKVQLVVKATGTDQLKLTALQLDGVLDAAGEPGNLGLAGQWTDIGLTTIGGVVYQVYNHSTTQAQVLVSNATVNLATTAQQITIVSAEANNTNFTETFNDGAAAGTTNTRYTSADGAWTIEATGPNGAALNASRGHVVGSYSPWSALGPDKHLILGDQLTQSAPGRENTFTSNFGTFDSIRFGYTDVNFTTGLYINFYDVAGNLIETTPFTAVGGRPTDAFFEYTLTGGKQAKSFKIVMTTDDAWGLDDLSMGLTATTQVLSSGGSSVDKTPILRGTYSSNLATDEVIEVYDGAVRLGVASVDLSTKTWSYQLTTNASQGSHTYTAKVVNGSSATIATSNNFSLSVLSSPLALDLNGDGVQTLGIEQGVQFDLLATGTAQNVGWLGGQDGWLALDQDANGRIDSGAELLGSSTRLADGSLARDGWQALAQHDGNADGVIDARDEVFLDLKVWVDANSNGQTDAGELRTLADHQIVRLDLNYAAGEKAQNGNILQGLSSFTTADGQSHQMVDAWLKVDQVLNMADAAEATADAAPAGELLQLNQLLSAAPQEGGLIEVLPVLDASASNAMLQSMLDLHTQNAAQP